MLLQLRNQTMVVGALGIGVEQMMELWRRGECECAQPKQQHQTGHQQSAAARLAFGCRPKAHSTLLQNITAGRLQDYLTPMANLIVV
jgi:hypothetical protein